MTTHLRSPITKHYTIQLSHYNEYRLYKNLFFHQIISTVSCKSITYSYVYALPFCSYTLGLCNQSRDFKKSRHLSPRAPEEFPDASQLTSALIFVLFDIKCTVEVDQTRRVCLVACNNLISRNSVCIGCSIRRCLIEAVRIVSYSLHGCLKDRRRE